MAHKTLFRYIPFFLRHTVPGWQSTVSCRGLVGGGCHGLQPLHVPEEGGGGGGQEGQEGGHQVLPGNRGPTSTDHLWPLKRTSLFSVLIPLFQTDCDLHLIQFKLYKSKVSHCRGMTVTSGVVRISKGQGNLIGISIGGGAPLCPCLYIVQVNSMK